MAFTGYAPVPTPGPGLSTKRTVCVSSVRSNFTLCCGGVAVQPGGSASFTSASAAPIVSLTTVTRTSRSAEGAPAAGAGAGAGGRCAPAAPRPELVAEPRPDAAVDARPEVVAVGVGVLRIDAA